MNNEFKKLLYEDDETQVMAQHKREQLILMETTLYGSQKITITDGEFDILAEQMGYCRGERG